MPGKVLNCKIIRFATNSYSLQTKGLVSKETVDLSTQ